MYPGDARSKWSPALLADPRVSHYWDQQRTVGTAYLATLPAMLARRAAATMPPTGDVMWDAFFVYAPDDRWQEPLPAARAWGYPIMVTRDDLVREIDELLRK